jgi:molybdenum cofactor biosynthesis protein A
MLVDSFGRKITYARLAVTDRCNLRCFYCMPAEGIDYLPKKDLLTYEEMERLISILTNLGVTKVRITGGEPFVRRDLIHFLERLRANADLEELHITTNGVLTGNYIDKLKDLNISSINLSLDTLNKEKFNRITRRNEFDNVMATYHSILDHDIPLKINMVVMSGLNEEDIIPMAELSLKHNVSVRYIEEMPFNGSDKSNKVIDYKKIITLLESTYGSLDRLVDPQNSTAYHYRIPGSKGNLGVIAAYTRTFCGSCNRIRITSEGTIKNCLYDSGGLNIRDLMRSGYTDEGVSTAIKNAIMNKHKDGWEAEANRDSKSFESMSSIGG